MMMFVIVMQMILDMGIRFLETHVGPSSKLLLANIYKELTTVSKAAASLFLLSASPPHHSTPPIKPIP